MAPNPEPGITRVGLVSDTHGWLDPRAVRVLEREAPLAGILHAGDIGADDVIYELERIARVTAVLGNCDYPLPGFDLGVIARVRLGGKSIVVVHDVHGLSPDAQDEIVVHGHSHRPRVEWQQERLFLNPGSATQRRHQPSCSVGILEITGDGNASAHIIYLDAIGPRTR
jgi:putative phosphoesterase